MNVVGAAMPENSSKSTLQRKSQVGNGTSSDGLAEPEITTELCTARCGAMGLCATIAYG